MVRLPSPEALHLGHGKIGVLGLGKLQGTFNAKRGITPGGPLSLLMFNVCIDVLVREMENFRANTICLAQSLGQNKSKARYST